MRSRPVREAAPPGMILEMKMPGSPVPNGTQEWSEPPMMLRPSGPPDLTSTTS